MSNSWATNPAFNSKPRMNLQKFLEKRTSMVRARCLRTLPIDRSGQIIIEMNLESQIDLVVINELVTKSTRASCCLPWFNAVEGRLGSNRMCRTQLTFSMTKLQETVSNGCDLINETPFGKMIVTQSRVHARLMRECGPHSFMRLSI